MYVWYVLVHQGTFTLYLNGKLFTLVVFLEKWVNCISIASSARKNLNISI